MDLASVTRQGVPSDVLQAGMMVRFAGHPSTERAHRMFVTNVLRADGLEVLLRARTLPRWSENFVGGTFLEPDASLLQADLENPPEGIFRVWVTAERNAAAFDDPPLTEAARLGRRGHRALHVSWVQELWDARFDGGCHSFAPCRVCSTR